MGAKWRPRRGKVGEVCSISSNRQLAKAETGWCIVYPLCNGKLLHPLLCYPTLSRRYSSSPGRKGARKTTFAQEFLLTELNWPTFLSADHIAAGLNPFRPENAGFRAGKMLLAMIEDYVSKGEGFGLETTMSGQGYARKIPGWLEMGYWVKLYLLVLPNSEIAIARVRQRLLEAGHDLPVETIRCRFHAGCRNFETIYRHLADEWVMYDNWGGEPVVMAQGGTNS